MKLTTRANVDTNAKDFAALLKHLDACEDAREWAKGKSAAEAWATCERGDWMLWLAARVGVDRRAVVLAACACARLSLKHVAPGDDRARIAIETAERWARGEATLEEVRAAADTAYAAYAAADAAYADAAYAVEASPAATAAARQSTLKECAEIVRRMIPVTRALSPEPEAKK